jgi:phage gp36-like protein
MTYATTADLQDAIPAQDLRLLTDRDGAADTVDISKLQAALEDANAEIDGWIAKRVTLPLADPPRMLNVVCRDLALHRLYVNASATVPDAVEKLREGQLAYLKSVSRGEVSIGDETSGDEITTSPGVVLDEGEAPVFTRDTLEGF